LNAAAQRPGSPQLETAAAEHQGLRLIALPDAAAVCSEVASRLLSERLLRPQRPLGLATGRTMEPVYAALVRRLSQLPDSERARLRDGWLSFNLDEYVGLPKGDPRSFRAAMQRQLAAPLGLDGDHLRLPDGQAADPQAEATRYSAGLQAAGGIGLQLLGLGLNGHVGFNEPPCGPEVTCRCLRLSEATRQANADAFGGQPAAVPERAITLGLREILAAERILLVVTGAAKAAVLRRLLQEPASEQLPASWLRLHPDVTLLVDRAALADAATDGWRHP